MYGRWGTQGMEWPNIIFYTFWSSPLSKKIGIFPVVVMDQLKKLSWIGLVFLNFSFYAIIAIPCLPGLNAFTLKHQGNPAFLWLSKSLRLLKGSCEGV